jgi:hypothetical protein
MAYPPASQRLTLLNQQGITPNSRAMAFLLNSRCLQLNALLERFPTKLVRLAQRIATYLAWVNTVGGMGISNLIGDSSKPRPL